MPRRGQTQDPLLLGLVLGLTTTQAVLCVGLAGNTALLLPHCMKGWEQLDPAQMELDPAQHSYHKATGPETPLHPPLLLGLPNQWSHPTAPHPHSKQGAKSVPKPVCGPRTVVHVRSPHERCWSGAKRGAQALQAIQWVTERFTK